MDSLLAWGTVLGRVIAARFASTCPKKWIIQVYAVTKDETEEEKEDFKQYTGTIEHQRCNSHHRKC